MQDKEHVHRISSKLAVRMARLQIHFEPMIKRSETMCQAIESGLTEGNAEAVTAAFEELKIPYDTLCSLMVEMEELTEKLK